MIPAIKFSTVVMGLLVSMIGAAAVITYDEGAVRVSVVEKAGAGTNVHLIVPAVLVQAGMGFIPNEELRKHAAEARAWLPAIKAASRELEHYPDFTLVEVRGPDENVSIAKRGDSLFIDVDSRDETVHVSFPVRVVNTVIQKLEASAESSPPA